LNNTRTAKAAAGLALLAGSLYLYFLYQSTELSTYGLACVSSFAVGSYLLVMDVRQLQSVRRMLPFLMLGGAFSVSLAAFGIDNYVSNSYYSQLLALAAARLTALMLAAGGVGVQVSGGVLTFPGGRALDVEPICSGASFSILFVLLSAVMVSDVGRTAPRSRLAVALVLGIIGANLANVFRITFLASIMYLMGLNALVTVHQFAGYAVFLGFMSVFWLLSLRWLSVGKEVNSTHL
jgi:exosortase/archaeosortase family protein